MSPFWRNWLMLWCWAVGVFGIVLAAGAFEGTDRPVRRLLGLLNGQDSLALDQTMRFALAVMGAVTIGWAITLWAAIKAALMLGAQGGPIWWLATLGALSWYAVDSGLSIFTGFGLNAVPNTLFIAAFLLPLLASGVLGAGRPKSTP